MGSTTEYDNIYNKSLFTELNMSSRYSPATLSSNMIPCARFKQFHYETSLYLNIITALYIELKNKEIVFDYNINQFNDCISKLNIIIDNVTNTSLSPKLSAFTQDDVFPNATKYEFTFYVKTFENYGNNPSDLYTNTIYSVSDALLTNCKPNFGSYPIILSNDTSINNFVFNGIGSTNNSFNKSNITRSTIVNPKLKEILRDILNQTPQNIIGYLLYQKIKYNITLYNIEIQYSIRRNYINNETTSGNSLNDISGRINIDTFGYDDKYITSTFTNLVNIKDKIQDCIDNINILNTNTFPTNNYLLDKNVYGNKINVFNNLREEYETILDKLNMSIKLYNIQINNYNKIKGYATIVIIILIMIVVFIISLSVLPIFNTKTKNSIYIITLIVLLIITYIYYNTFKFVNLYEQFGITNVVSISDFQVNQTLLTCPPVIRYNSSINIHRINHANFYNNLNAIIVSYNDTVANIFNSLRMNVYTIGSQSFTKDSDVLLYKLYLEKKRQLEVNRIKLTNLFNIIEIIKKQTNYLFNIILIIAMLTIVLLIGLLLFSTVPQLIYPIIILCVILIVIIMIYFAFTIIQPTRMVANKNYWAITNPTSKTTGKI